MSRIDDLIQKLCPDGVRAHPLGELVRIRNGKSDRALGPGNIPVYGSGGVMRCVDTAAHPGPSVLIPRKGSLANLFFVDGPFWTVDTIFYTEIGDRILPKFLYHFLLTKHLDEMNQAGGVPSMTQSVLNHLPIPVPPLPVQEEIVRILDSFTSLEAELEAELEARKKQYEYYRHDLLLNPIASGKAEWMTLGDLGQVRMCKRVMKNQTSSHGEVPFYKIGTFGNSPDSFISRRLFNDYKQRYSFPEKGDVLISAAGTIGRAIPYDGEDAYFQDSNIVWIANDEKRVMNKYLYYWYGITDWSTEGGTIKRLYNSNLRNTRILVPPFETQSRIVSILDSFDSLVHDLSSGLPAEIVARRKQYEFYRDRLLSFKELAA